MDDLEPGATNTSSNMTEKPVGKKRKRSRASLDNDDQPAEKYQELSDVFTLDRFSDEVLFEIFKHLDTAALQALEKAIPRFYGLVQDRRLWNNVNLLGEKNTVHDLKKTLKRAHVKTNSIKISGLLGLEYVDKLDGQKECILKHIIPKCENLTDLELQGVFIDFLETKIEDFPKNLKRLVFREVSVRWPENAPTVFQKMDKTLLWLEELSLESCTWFHPYDIMLFSKCPSLKRLSLRGCQNLSDFVPYGSMASRFGFKILESLDIRDTPINDSDLQCFNAILTLKELHLQCPTYLRIPSPDDKNTSPPTVPISYRFTAEEVVRELDLTPEDTASTSSSSSSSATSFDGNSSTCTSSDIVPAVSVKQRTNYQPSTSRRRNLVMSLDFQCKTRTVILNGRVCEIPESEFKRLPHPHNALGHIGSLLRHPHFWDMIDRQSGPNCGPPCVATTPRKCPVTNRGIACFGRPANPIDQNVIWIRIGYRPTDNKFERLVLRHYKRINDDALRHLVQCSPHIVYLDVTGTGVTQEGVDEFKFIKPECTVVCEHLENK